MKGLFINGTKKDNANFSIPVTYKAKTKKNLFLFKDVF